MRSLGLGEYFESQLHILKKLLPLNLTTTSERQAPQRSDAHPWSTYPSVVFLKIVAGITPAEPEFRSVRITPTLGNLQFIRASFPHYLGNIIVNLQKTKTGGIRGNSCTTG
jgi:alpha-L-rhamnosidase